MTLARNARGLPSGTASPRVRVLRAAADETAKNIASAETNSQVKSRLTRAGRSSQGAVREGFANHTYIHATGPSPSPAPHRSLGLGLLGMVRTRSRSTTRVHARQAARCARGCTERRTRDHSRRITHVCDERITRRYTAKHRASIRGPIEARFERTLGPEPRTEGSSFRALNWAISRLEPSLGGRFCPRLGSGTAGWP